MLEWMKIFDPEFFKSIHYKILEISPQLINRQKSNLKDHSVEWINQSVINGVVEPIEGAVISNELFDALPFELLQLIGEVPTKKTVSIKDNQWVEGFMPLNDHELEYLAENRIVIESERLIPVTFDSVPVMERMAGWLQRGAVLAIDYGYTEQRFPLTHPYRVYGLQDELRVHPYDLQAVYRLPGQVDITSDVNFGTLSLASRRSGLISIYLDSQSDFLKCSGLQEILEWVSSSLVHTPMSATEILRIERDISRMGISLEDNYQTFIAFMATKDVAQSGLVRHSGLTAQKIAETAEFFESSVVLKIKG